MVSMAKLTSFTLTGRCGIETKDFKLEDQMTMGSLTVGKDI